MKAAVSPPTCDQTGESAFVVVRNQQDQYSVWWHDRAVPDGWTAVSTPTTRSGCLALIDELWTDMRPVSQR